MSLTAADYRMTAYWKGASPVQGGDFSMTDIESPVRDL